MKPRNYTAQFTKWISGAAVAVLFGSIGYLASSRFSQPEIVPGAGLAHPESGALTAAGLSGLPGGPAGSQPPGAAGPGGPAASPAPAGRAGAAGAVSPAAKPLLGVKGGPAGSPLTAAGMNPDADKGRVLRLDPAAARKWGALKPGDSIALPTASGDPVEGTVNLVQEDGAWLRLGGFLADGQGSFSLNTNSGSVAGMILLPESGVGYQIQMDGPDAVLIERRMSSLVCYPAARGGTEMAAAAATAGTTGSRSQPVPLVNTRPGAKGVIYVDFDGETVTQNVWNGGRTITASPSSLTNEQITQALNIAAQDWTPFDVTLTTDPALYNSTPDGLRMHVVVTPTDTAAPGAGGIGYVNSWSDAGRGMVSGVVCWVFNQTVKTVAEAVSHEVGHTVGLNHDGLRGGVDYYGGHGGGLSTPTSWAPIMGAGYSKAMVQWSRGEYANANNTEDDLAIIARPLNRFGLVGQEMVNGPRELLLSGGAFKTEGLLRGSSSVDTYSFTTSGGALSASVAPAAADSDVDVRLELWDDKGATLAVSDPVAGTSASISKTLPPGAYKLLVAGAGTGPAPAGGYTTGYSAYGSVGKYTLSGSLTGAISLPVFTSPATVTGTAGLPLSYKVEVSAGSRVAVEKSVLPAGLSFDPATLVLSGTPLDETGPGKAGEADGPGLLVLAATNNSGTARANVEIRIAPAGSSLSGAFPYGTVTSSPASPWTGVSVVRADGAKGTVAQSALIPNGGKTVVQFTYTPPADAPGRWSILTFYWKASTEPLNFWGTQGDFAQCFVNGFAKRDADTGRLLFLSGETGWVKQVVRLEGAGAQRVEFSYTKDRSLASGQDRVWVYVEGIGQPPVVLSNPAGADTVVGGTVQLAAEVSGADTLVWKRDRVTLADGVSAGGGSVSGANTAALNISGVTGADSGSYWLEARNAFGSVSTRPVYVVVQAPPVVVRQPAAPAGLKVGDSLVLSAGVSGAAPLYYQWKKDGVPFRWNVAFSSTVNLMVPRVGASSSGRYSLVLLNQFGTVVSEEVEVAVGASTGGRSFFR